MGSSIYHHRVGSAEGKYPSIVKQFRGRLATGPFVVL